MRHEFKRKHQVASHRTGLKFPLFRFFPILSAYYHLGVQKFMVKIFPKTHAFLFHGYFIIQIQNW